MIKPQRLFIVFLLLIAASSLSAKTAGVRATASRVFEGKTTIAAVKQSVSAFESALTPYFQARAVHAKPGKGVAAPTDADFIALAKCWELLSPSFKALYLKATQIPSDMTKYVSPSGHFEIYYYTSGIEAVDLTDTIGFSSTDWRTQTHEPNGVPDYVDQVAYAADSAWSMEIDRFGFVKPWPYMDQTHNSSLYKIALRLMTGDDATTYAYTFPEDNAPAGNIGFTSYIETRSEWNGPVWSDYGYNMHPENAVRVTCCHEFFHGVQYAMARSYTDIFYVDDFPVTFLEGSAVLMEDLGFDYVNDYFQYVGDFFGDPYGAIFKYIYEDGDPVYKNALPTMYLYQLAYPSPRIDFIKNLLFNNYHQFTRFYNNLVMASGQAGRTWPDILGGFFTGSYYTGPRAAPGRFIADAPLLKDEWVYPQDQPDQSFSVSKTVQPFGMNTFSFTMHNGGAPLNIVFSGDGPLAGDADTNAVWNLRCILKKDASPAHDSIIVIPNTSATKAGAAIANWQDFIEALVIATNARYDSTRNGKVTFMPCGITYRSGDSATVTSIPSGAPLTAPYAAVSVKALTDLSCSLSVKETNLAGSSLLDSARNDSLAALGTFYDISFPLTWLHNAGLVLSIVELKQQVDAIASAHAIPDTLFDICRWDDSSSSWKPIMSQLLPRKAPDSLTYIRRCLDSVPGIYGLFGLLPNPNRDHIDSVFTALPNPARLKRDGSIRFKGRNILEIWIYSIDGRLVSHAVKGQNSQPRSLPEYAYGFEWKLCNNSGTSVPPGVYFAQVGYKNEATRGMNKKLQKIFVLP
ncbi:MAG TPA: hypothetical protein VLX68_10070 [Chitinivibrionales bacterium]|nr:hypothetical protein [Chitinivibrionales bacterium]